MSSQIQWGISLIVLPLLSERVGERLLRVCFRLYEIPLQIIRHYCSQINSLSLKIAFVTFRKSVSYKEGCKRCPFVLQNMPFYTSKDALLQCKRASFRRQKGVDGKAGRKEIDKNKKQTPKRSGLPKPLRRRGCERKREEKKADHSSSEGEDVPGGIRNAMCWGDKRGRFKAKSSWVNSQRSNV